MTRDVKSVLSDAQPMAAFAVGDNASTNYYYAGADNANVGGGGNKKVYCIISTAVTSAGAATVAFHLEDSNDLSAWTAFIQTPAIGKATLVAGYAVRGLRGLILPEDLLEGIRGNYVVATADLTAGAAHLWIV